MNIIGVDDKKSIVVMLEKMLDVKMEYKQLPWRESDQKVFVADIKKAQDIIGWTPVVSSSEGISKMVEWLR